MGRPDAYSVTAKNELSGNIEISILLYRIASHSFSNCVETVKSFLVLMATKRRVASWEALRLDFGSGCKESPRGCFQRPVLYPQ